MLAQALCAIGKYILSAAKARGTRGRLALCNRCDACKIISFLIDFFSGTSSQFSSCAEMEYLPEKCGVFILRSVKEVNWNCTQL